MASNVDITVPTSPDAYTGPVRQNFATIADEITTLQNALAGLGGPYLPISGGILTGPLALASDPTTAMGAATKQYADRAIHDAIGAFLPLYGGTLTGPLRLMTAAGALSTDDAGNLDLYSPSVAVGSDSSGEVYLWSGNAVDGSTGGGGLGTGDIIGGGGGSTGLVELWTGNNFGTGQTGAIAIYTGDAAGSGSGRLLLSTGDAATPGNSSGGISLTTGRSTDGLATRGDITLDGLITTINAPQSQDAPWTGMAPALFLRSDAAQYGPALVFGPGTASTPGTAFGLLRYVDALYISTMPMPGDTGSIVGETDLFSISKDGMWIAPPVTIQGSVRIFNSLTVDSLTINGPLSSTADIGASGRIWVTDANEPSYQFIVAGQQRGQLRQNADGTFTLERWEANGAYDGPIWQTNTAGVTLFTSPNGDPFQAYCAAPASCRLFLDILSFSRWSIGPWGSDGHFRIYDETNGRDVLTFDHDTGGTILAGPLTMETTADPQIVGTVLDIAATGVGANGWAYLYTINQPAGDTGQAGLGSGDAAAGNTGSIYLYSGNSAVGTSGGVTIATGNASGAGNTSGGMILQTGTVANGATRGTITLDAPVISLKGTLVTADASGAGNASGDIILQPGAVSGGATQGRVFLNGPTYIALPTADPHVPYMLWCDPTAGNVLKMSAG